MKILMLISSFHPLVGGGEVQAQRLAQALCSMGHEVTIVTRHAVPSTPRREKMGDVLVLRRGSASTAVYAVASLFRLLFSREKFDVVHAMQSATPLAIACLYSLFRGTPVVCTPMNGSRELVWIKGRSGIVKKPLFRFTKRWIAKSSEIENALKAYATDITPISNGVDTDVFCPGERPPGSKPLVLAVCRLLAPKRIDLVLSVWKEFEEEAELRIVGDGPLRGELEQQAKGLKGVVFAGAKDDVPSEMKSADIFLMLSDSEGMPNALLEGMSSGLASIGSPVGAIPDMLEGGAGWTLQENSPAALAEALRTLIRQPEERARYAERGRQRVFDRYSLQSTAKKVAAVYQECLKGGGR